MHRWLEPFLVKGPELAPCSALFMGSCSICRSHPALPRPWVPSLPAGQNPALSHLHWGALHPCPQGSAQSTIASLPPGPNETLCLGLISTCRSAWPCPWSDFQPWLCLQPLHPGPGPQLHPHRWSLSYSKTPEGLHEGQRLWKEKQPQGEGEAHVGGAGNKASCPLSFPPLRDQGNRPKQGVWGSGSPSPHWESAGLHLEHGGVRGAAILPHELPL